MDIYIMSKIKRLMALVCTVAILGAAVGCEESNNRSIGAERGKLPFTFAHSGQDLEETYILNTSSRRIHLPSCLYAEKTAEKNRLPISDVTQALREGYTYCSRCLPTDTDTENEENRNAES